MCALIVPKCAQLRQKNLSKTVP